MTDDATLLSRVRRMWERADPPPAHLADRVLFALELEDLETEFELLRLTERDDAGVGARGSGETASDVTHITFSGPSLTVMLAIAGVGHRRRVDGWIAPAARSRVVAHTGEGGREAVADETGRFVLDDVSAGMLRLVIHTEPTDDDTVTPFVTPTVEI